MFTWLDYAKQITVLGPLQKLYGMDMIMTRGPAQGPISFWLAQVSFTIIKFEVY